MSFLIFIVLCLILLVLVFGSGVLLTSIKIGFFTFIAVLALAAVVITGLVYYNKWKQRRRWKAKMKTVENDLHKNGFGKLTL